LLNENNYTSTNDRVIANISAVAKLYKNLDFTTTYAVDRLRTDTYSYDSPIQGNGYSSKGNAANVTAIRDNWNWTNTLNYSTTLFDKHSLSALAGYDIQKLTYNSWGASRTQSADPYFENYQGNWGAISATGNDISEKTFLSFFSRLSYDYNKKYFLTFNFRVMETLPWVQVKNMETLEVCLVDGLCLKKISTKIQVSLLYCQISKFVQAGDV
jgi:hypothetical protein